MEGKMRLGPTISPDLSERLSCRRQTRRLLLPSLLPIPRFCTLEKRQRYHLHAPRASEAITNSIATALYKVRYRGESRCPAPPAADRTASPGQLRPRGFGEYKSHVSPSLATLVDYLCASLTFSSTLTNPATMRPLSVARLKS